MLDQMLEDRRMMTSNHTRASSIRSFDHSIQRAITFHSTSACNYSTVVSPSKTPTFSLQHNTCTHDMHNMHNMHNMHIQRSRAHS